MSEDQKLFKISEDNGLNERLDAYLAQNQDLAISRAYAQELIKTEKVFVNNKKSKSSYKLKAGDELSISVPEPVALDVVAENIPLDIIFEDDEFLVINKPINMVTHPAQGVHSGTLVNAIMYHCKDKLSSINGVMRPGIVHRLDKDTSGLIVVAKTDAAHQSLADQIQKRSLERRYLALVHQNIKADKGVINKNIARHPKYRHRMGVSDNSGRYATTRWLVKKRFEFKSTHYCLVECKLETGRTHQIRVHMSHFRHPIVGDLTYGSDKVKNGFKVSRPMLHSYKLSLDHPKTGERLSFEIPLPADFQDALQVLQS